MPFVHRVLDPTVNEQIAPGLCALAIMTKAPRPGAVKTRLQPPLTAEEAAALNICFLRDIAEAIARACVRDDLSAAKSSNTQSPPREVARGVAIYTPIGAETAYADILPGNFDLVAQRGDSFGERLFNAAEDLLRVGFASCCLINSDSPTVTADTFRQALNLLEAAGDRIVLGPSDDGGYYLIGMKKLYPRVFDEVDWSTERVFAQTVTRAREIGIEICTLPSSFDVDDRPALERLCEDLLGAAVDKTVAPTTRKFLTDAISREGRTRIWPTTVAS